LGPERLTCKPKKLAVTESTLHLHWLPPESTIEWMKTHGAQFLIELYDYDAKSLKQAHTLFEPEPVGILCIADCTPVTRRQGSWVSCSTTSSSA
tara:strand:- start:124 stop:405 length:282 start_codon:yes stop_codon:yes gene_type:complete